MREAEFAALVDAWLAGQRSPNTKAAYGQDLAAFGAWCRSNEQLPLRVTADDVARYRAFCEQGGASDASVARRLSSLRSFFRYARDDTDNPAYGVASPPRAAESSTTVLDDATATALLRAAERIGPKPALLVRLLLLDGMRLQEVIEANLEDVDGATRPATIAVTRHGREALVPLQRQTVRSLGRYAGTRKRGPVLLAEGAGNGRTRLTRFGADYLLKKTSTEAGLSAPVSANTLRRHYVSRSHAAGASLDDIRHHVGHRDVRTTQRYLEPSSRR